MSDEISTAQQECRLNLSDLSKTSIGIAAYCFDLLVLIRSAPSVNSFSMLLHCVTEKK